MASDYVWGYSEDQLNHYKLHAERLYQLFCLRYTYKNLTPYMMKFIDYGLHFMTNLNGIPLNRLSTEGGEHSNCDQNCFYYQHTTRKCHQTWIHCEVWSAKHTNYLLIKAAHIQEGEALTRHDSNGEEVVEQMKHFKIIFKSHENSLFADSRYHKPIKTGYPLPFNKNTFH